MGVGLIHIVMYLAHAVLLLLRIEELTWLPHLIRELRVSLITVVNIRILSLITLVLVLVLILSLWNVLKPLVVHIPRLRCGEGNPRLLGHLQRCLPDLISKGRITVALIAEVAKIVRRDQICLYFSRKDWIEVPEAFVENIRLALTTYRGQVELRQIIV